MKIPEEIIEKIKENNDIVDIIGEKVKLKRTGSNHMGLCPFHSEKSPSFSVNQQKQFFNCFGCGEGGDIFTFIMKTQQLSFFEAAQLLAERAGIDLPKEDQEDQGRRYARETLENINRTAARFYFDQLRALPDARKYFLDRGISERTITQFGLGYAPDSWDAALNFLKRKGFKEEDIRESGLMSGIEQGKCYDRFRNRLMFPVFDYRGRVTGFGARVLDDSKPKYLNSPETLLFRKGTNLYGLNFFLKNRKKEDDFLIIVEGYMDCIALHQAGLSQAVAALGTALTREQARLMKRYVRKVVTAFDSDTAGQIATMRGLEILVDEGFEVKILEMPEGQDPDDLVKQRGAEGFLKLLDNALSYTEFQLNAARSGLDLKKEEDKVTYFKNLQPILEKLNGVERDIWVSKLSDETGVTRSAILTMTKGGYSDRVWTQGRTPGNYVESGHRKAQRVLLKLMALGYEGVAQAIGEEELTGASHQRIYRLLSEYRGDNPDAFMMTTLNEPEDQAEWAQIFGTSDLPDDIEIDRLIDDYVRTVHYYNLKKKKKAMVDEIAVLEKEGRLSESLVVAKELLEIQRELGGK